MGIWVRIGLRIAYMDLLQFRSCFQYKKLDLSDLRILAQVRIYGLVSFIS